MSIVIRDGDGDGDESVCCSLWLDVIGEWMSHSLHLWCLQTGGAKKLRVLRVMLSSSLSRNDLWITQSKVRENM